MKTRTYIYEVSDMEARKTYKVRGVDLRTFLHAWAGQCTKKFRETVDFVADFYEGKHEYRWQTMDAEDYLGIQILCTGTTVDC